MAVMAALAAGAVVGGIGLIGTGITSWMSSRSEAKAREEHQRAQALQIKFAEEETKREEVHRARTHQLAKAGQNFNMMDSIVKNTQNMFMSNRAVTDNIIKYQKARG